jgi:hypothetical protein
MRRILAGLGLPVDLDKDDKDSKGDYYINAALDKDHGALGKSQIEEALVMALRTFMFASKNIDYSLDFYTPLPGNKAKGAHAENMPGKWAKVLLGEGNLPFKDPSVSAHLLYQPYAIYQQFAIVRRLMANRLNALLRGWGSPAIPAGVHFGQRTIDTYYTRQIVEALARGELLAKGTGIPEKNPRYEPVSELLDYIAAVPDTALKAATTLNSFPDELLQYEPIGYAGQLSIVRAQFELGSGAWVLVNGAMDTVTQSLIYAQIQVKQPDGEPETVTAEGLVTLLREHGLDVEHGYTPGEALKKLAKDKLTAALPSPEEGSREIRGMHASPGTRPWLVGQVTFDHKFYKSMEEARWKDTILVMPYTTPDDLQAIGKVGGMIPRTTVC